LPFFPLPNPESIPFLIAGVVFHFGYQLSLLSAYRFGDLTQVYPIARGTAPMLVAGISVVFLGVDLGMFELIAIALIGIGIFSLAAVRQGTGHYNPKAAAIAFLTGCFIAGYSLADGLGARAAGNAIGFYSWMTLINAAIFALYLRITKPGLLKQVATKGLKITVFGGAASYIAYGLVIWSFTQAPIAMVTALRETSIVFALLIGVYFLKERLNLVKVFATVMTVAGSIVLRFAK